MKRIKLLLSVLFVLIIYTSANPRTASEAKQIALDYLGSGSYSGQQKAPTVNNLQLTYTEKHNDLQNENGLFYVFNIGDNAGFVVVSGNEKATEVLGYADSGTFYPQSIPDGLRFWLNHFTEELISIEENQEITAAVIYADDNSNNNTIQKSSASTQFLSEISPLLSGIKWNQGEPYNNLCPIIPTTSQRSVTGCVATGMAQVMKFHEWPVHGTGANTYTTTTHSIPLSVDFSTATYDWANMTNTYDATSTNEEKLAVATLMYHCGVATNMDYAESSGTTTSKMATALINNFGYDTNLNKVHRDYFTRSEWSNVLKTELNASRPVLYGGQSAGGGHLFVCDGYDTNNYFHFNWGWGGMSNGYFALSALNPSSEGIGGGSGGYNSYQDIVVGIQEPNPATVPFYSIYMQEPISSSKATVTRSGKTTITIKKTFNFGVNIFSGNLGLGLYNGDNLIEVVNSFSATLNPNTGYNALDRTNIAISAGVANGTYKLHTIYKPTGATTWSKVRGYVGTPDFLYVQVSDTEITYTNATDYTPELTVNALSVTGNVYQNKTGRFCIQLTNTGEEYNSKLAVYLQAVGNSSVYQMFTEDANIATNETATYYFNNTVTMAPGDYYLMAMYDPNNVRATATTLTQLGSTQTISILATPTDPPVFTLTSQISFPDNGNVNKTNAILSAPILNTGGYFENNMITFIFPDEGGSSLTYIGYQKAYFDTNEQKTLSFSGSIDLDPDQYMTVVYYYNGSAWTRLLPTNYSGILFTIQPDFTTINMVADEISRFDIYPNPALNEIFFISTDIVDQIGIYHIDGKLVKTLTPKTNGKIQLDVSSINRGNYLIQIKTPSGIKVSRFVKN